jgi:hypothetical protein
MGPEDQISMVITKEDFQAYWKKSKERTSYSLLGLTFGHYKAAMYKDTLSEMHAVFMDIALNLGYSPTHWQRGLAVMLEKKKGVIIVDKLRAILMMEADFNFGNKTTFAQCMMFTAEDHDEVAEECFGNRRNHEATGVALNRHFFCHIF